MPSGSKVIANSVSFQNKIYFNIYIYPLTMDAYHTTGLCGNYNLDPDDEL